MDKAGVQLPSNQVESEIDKNFMDVAQEKSGLAQYGIHLADDHYDGYFYRPDRFLYDTSGIKKPWELGILEQFGPAVPINNATVEGWDNSDFLFEVKEGIAYCTLNRVNANNAMNEKIVAGLHDSAIILRNRPDTRIAILTGSGRMFCAGGDPKSFQQTGAAAIQEHEEQENPSGTQIASTRKLLEGDEIYNASFARDLYEWATLPQFTICCMNGSAMGAGVGLLSVCDMAVAVRTAHITLSEVKLGVIPSVISPHVIRAIGTASAKSLFCTAENANMKTAMEIGLVQRIVNDASEFPAVIKEISQKLQACAPGAVAAAKQTIFNTIYQPVSTSLIEYTAKKYAEVRKTKECEEGMKALAEKKKPSWVDKVIEVKE